MRRARALLKVGARLSLFLSISLSGSGAGEDWVFTKRRRSVMANEGTPVRLGAVSVPYGHVIGHEKWKGSLVAQGIQGKVKLILEDGLGVVDFHLSNRSCVLYISEADLVAGNGFKRRLVRFRNVSVA
uniref:Fanconi anemia core complex-associated protein 24-like n=1 Tax=Podarcis muralis TaxID=64176 RepID=UPI00109F4CFB|nr:Fanconi anemia core complex-associated protein 24-like [Podarcis muralis]XP_028589464.1 Fanconi anemia core complex-associated protein 24-like [Podarcis muralis]XP_028599984.1 Fanconi anemia core complex-associated protein 24-like [Podarcis muralis]XP_028606586.1 Fanconi anemia core complex-associated protein 24-like [Podarcis muralis]